MHRIAFRNRAGHEPSRLEGFSDAVFGFALTLIVVSLEVPDTFDDLLGRMRGLPGFAICFAFLVWIWHEHHTYFRRYALTDEWTIVLNTILLFIVLTYVYPLKFLFTLLTGAAHRADAIRTNQWGTLMLIYAAGFIGVFTVLLLMYVHAYRLRGELQLNAVEAFDTNTMIILYSGYVGIGVLSALIALVANRENIRWSGWIYACLGIVGGVVGWVRGSRRARVESALTA